MRQLFCWIAANAQTLSAIAAIVTVFVTAAYLYFTIKIFREARRSADKPLKQQKTTLWRRNNRQAQPARPQA
jgi:uncharacterized protein (DUF697 family)